MKLKSDTPWPWATLAVAGAAQFLVLLEATVITVAIPRIGAELGTGAGLAWVVTGYLLAFGALLLPGGAWADRVGRRPVFLAGLAVFGAASVLCALAPGLEILVASRVTQGLGAGVLAASALGIVVARYVDPRQRAIAMTVWSTLGVVGGVVGSLSAGPLIAWLDWPGVFWINVLAVAALWPAALRVVRTERGAESGPGSAPGSAPATSPALLAGVGATLALLGLSTAETRLVLGGLVLAAGALVLALVLRQQRRAAAPILPVYLLRTRSYRTSVLGLFAANGVMLGTMFAYSRHLQEGYELSATAASLAVLPMSLAALLVAFSADALIGRRGDRPVLLLGGLLLTVGTLALLAVSAAELSWGWLVVAGAVVGAALPACFVPLNRLAFSAVAPAEAGAASGLTNTLTTVGGAFAVTAVTLLGSVSGQPGAYAPVLALSVALAALALSAVRAPAGEELKVPVETGS